MLFMKSKDRYLSLFASILIAAGGLSQTNMTPLWSAVTHATTSDGVTELWISPQGESYQLGNITSLPGHPALDGMMLVKADANGNELWRKYFHGQDNNYQLFAASVVGDENGNVFVVYADDFRYTDLNSARIAVRKLDANGNEIWSNYYTEEINNLVESPLRRTGLYKNGLLYFISGTSGLNPGDDSDAMIVKIDGASGNLIQKIVFNSPYDTDDFFRKLEVADNGDVWAVGRSRGYMYPGGIYSDYDANLVKYNSEGQFQWEHRENGTGNSEDYGISLAIDAAGNSYTSNQLRMIGTGQRRVQIQKIDPSGQVLWNHFYQGSSSGYNHDQPVAVLPNGNVVFSTSNENGIVTKALDGQTGQQLWSQNYNRSEAGAANRPYSLKADSEGNIYITGESRDNTPFGDGWDVVTMKYSSAGELLWLSNFTRGNYDTMGETGVALRLDAAENVYVAGWTQLNQAGNYNSDFLLLKYGNGNLGTKQSELTASALRCFPNPVADVMNIRDESAIAKVVLYDLYGSQIREWENQGKSNEVSLNMGGIAQGVYRATVFSEGRIRNLKIMKK